MNKVRSAFLTLALLLNFIQAAQARTYVVRTQETLSQFLFKNFKGRIYGAGNNLEYVLKLNPKLKKSKTLVPGQTIEVGHLVLIQTDATPSHESPAPSSANTVASPEFTSPSDLEFNFRAGYGASLFHVLQSGDLGALDSSGIAVNLVQAKAMASFEKWFGAASFSRYSLNLGTDTSSNLSTVSKAFQNFSLNVGRGNIYAGVFATQTPLLKSVGRAVQWADMLTFYGTLGARCTLFKSATSQKPFQISGSAQFEIPFLTSTPVGVSTSKPRGLGATGTIEAKKYFADFSKREILLPKLALGLEARALFDYLKLNASWGSNIGAVSRSSQEYQTIIFLGLDL